jgi:hypothetical protein
MIVGEDYQLGRGSVTNAPGYIDNNTDVFGLGQPKLPWEGPTEVFGMGDGEGGCNCPILNYKNVSMVVAGGLIAYWGIKTGNRTADIVIRIAGGGMLAAGLYDILSSYHKKASAVPQAAPVPKATPVPSDEKDLVGLGSEWYADVPRNEYLNRFASALRSKCGKCAGKSLGECYSCMGE